MRDFYRFQNAAGPGQPEELYIYDEVSWWGVTADAFRASLKAVKSSELLVRINSPGGNVFDGLAIFNLLRDFRGTVTVKVDGIAASIASVIAMAGKRVVMPKTSGLFIHNPLVQYATGNAEELRTIAADLDKISGLIEDAYMARVSISREELRKMLAAETLLTPAEALRMGFIDEILPVGKNDTNATAFKAVAQLTPTMRAAWEKHFPATPAGQHETQDTMDDNIKPLEDTVAKLTARAEASELALKNATDSANADKTRREGIAAAAKQYGADGRFNALALEAMAGTTTVEQFKDKLLESLASAPPAAAAPAASAPATTPPARAAIRPQDGAALKPVTDVETFIAAYNAAPDAKARLALVNKHQSLALQAQKN